MATTEKVGIFTHVDDKGNTTLLYPVTKMEAVDGLPEATAKLEQGITKSVQKSNVVNNFTTTEEGFVADARALKALNDKLGNAKANAFRNDDQLTCSIESYDGTQSIWFQYTGGNKTLKCDVKFDGQWNGEFVLKQW